MPNVEKKNVEYCAYWQRLGLSVKYNLVAAEVILFINDHVVLLCFRLS